MLAACAPPPELTAQGVRPGLSSGADYARARARGGLAVRYDIVMPSDAPLRVGMNFRTRAGRGGTVAYSGALRMVVPGGNAEEVAKVLLPKDVDLPFDVRGNAIIFPNEGLLDRKGRHLEMRSRLLSANFTPHDCYAVLGICRSSAVGSNGQSVSVIIETTEMDGIWRSTTRLDPAKMGGSNKLVKRSVFSLDRNLMPIDIKSIDYTERPYQTVLIRRAP